MSQTLQCTIYIGRDDNTSRLGAFLSPTKGTLLDIMAPNCVSRYKPREQTAHCKLEVYKDGQLKLINLNPQNVTYADGRPIDRAWVTADTSVELGYARFRLPLAEMLDRFGYRKPYQIDHLQAIYQEYQDKLVQLQLKQAKDASKQRLQGLFSLLGMAVLFIPFQSLGFSSALQMTIRGVFVGAALLLCIYFLFRSSNPRNTAVMQKMSVDNWLKEHYRCPNPECQIPFKPHQDYLSLKSMGQCPYCKCKLVETKSYVNHHQPSSSCSSNQLGYAY